MPQWCSSKTGLSNSATRVRWYSAGMVAAARGPGDKGGMRAVIIIVGHRGRQLLVEGRRTDNLVRRGFDGQDRPSYGEIHGTLAATRLDNHLHVWHGIRAVSGFGFTGLRVGPRVDFLMGILQASPPSRDDLIARLKPHGQAHLLRFWDDIDEAGRARLSGQVAAIDFGQIHELFGQTATEDWDALSRRAEPPPAMRLSERDRGGRFTAAEARERGLAALRAGEIGVLLTAGGQGSRLGFDHPKGMYPIGPVSRASLLEIHLQKALATGRRYGAPVPVYLMTSPVTHEEQTAFLWKFERFGLPPGDLVIFCQGTMPAVDAKSGKLLLAAKDELFLSPDGHGGTVAALAGSGAIENMRRRGIKHLFYLQVDNPLAPICEAEMIGYHLLAQSELTSMAVAKQAPRDKVGNFVSIDGRVHVIEYSDFPDDVAEKRGADGSLVFWAGSIAVHVFAVSFLERALSLKEALPFHVAHKKVPYIADDGQLIEPTAPNALKFERFIFDLVPHAENAIVVEYAEEDVFAPLKNAPGAERDTAEYVERFMIDQHRRWLTAAGTKMADDVPVEISPLWALDEEGAAARADRPQAIDKPTYLTEN
jgi:UDP-N-acetylglucosamine/UDP-N-acetylgalactosamine diphosphorylase